mgnify:CR=1 FL=1
MEVKFLQNSDKIGLRVGLQKIVNCSKISKLVFVASQGIKLRTEHEIESFVNQLFSCEEHSFCPFGKPIMQTLTIEELTTKF